MKPKLSTLRARVRREDGFTLVEVMVAMGIATVILSAFAYASTGSLRALQTARLNQQGADLATQQVELVRNMPFGAIGHDPGGVVGDPRLEACSGGTCLSGEPLVTAVGGLSPQVTTTQLNNFTYSIYTYITSPDDSTGADTRRITVIAEWAAFGRTFSKTMSTLVTQSQRGLPLPEFKFAPIGPEVVTVNPGAQAAFGYQLSNQGAPDQWNITSDAPGYSLLLDNGDDVFNADEDVTPMTDHNGDGVPDTGRLEPKESVVFWVVVPVSAAAPDGTSLYDVTAQASTQPNGTSASETLVATLIVTSGTVVAPTPSPTVTDGVQDPGVSEPCPAPTAVSPPSAAAGYTVRSYVLHNSGAVSWPTFPLPASDPIPGSTAMSPMYMDFNPVSIPATRDLPYYSTDLGLFRGRILQPGQSVEFRTQYPNRSYTSTMLLRYFSRTFFGDAQISAQVFTQKTNGSQAVTLRGAPQTVTYTQDNCSTRQEVLIGLDPGTFSAGNNTVLGVKLTNTGDHFVTLAYDHEVFPATFTVVEK